MCGPDHLRGDDGRPAHADDDGVPRVEGGESASASVEVGQLRVVVQQSSGGYVRPTWVRYRDSKCNVSDVPSRENLTVWVEDGAGKRLPGRTITLSLRAIARSGGHTHGGTAPTGTLDRMTVTTDAGGSARVVYVASEFAGDYVVRGEAAEAEPGADTIKVGLTLEPFPAGQDYRLVGAGDELHDSRFHTTAAMRNELLWLAASLVQTTGIRVGYNDMSIPRGGRFDTDANFDYPHCSHRHGEAVDIRVLARDGVPALTQAQIDRATLLWTRRRGDKKTLWEGNHLHFKY